MLRSWKIGKVFDIGIYVHWSFLALLALVFYYGGQGPHKDGLPPPERDNAVAFFAVALVVSVFACVVLHELGHALMARYFGIKTRDITLLPIGGVARLERMSDKPWEEICIAVAGPAVNVVIAAVLFGLGHLVKAPWLHRSSVGIESLPQFLHVFGFVSGLWFLLLCSNILLVVFNMIPMFPMDGGRVFRALLTSIVGLRPATEVAAFLALVLASAMGIYGVYDCVKQGQFSVLPLVALFVMFVGQQELAAVRQRTALREAPPIDVLPAGPSVIQTWALAPEPGFSGFTWDRQHHVWIEWRDGRAIHACRVASQ